MQRLYVQALLETNPLNLIGRATAAEITILARVEELCNSSDGQEEWQAMEDAITGLAALKREILRLQMAINREQPKLRNARLHRLAGDSSLFSSRARTRDRGTTLSGPPVKSAGRFLAEYTD